MQPIAPQGGVLPWYRNTESLRSTYSMRHIIGHYQCIRVISHLAARFSPFRGVGCSIYIQTSKSKGMFTGRVVNGRSLPVLPTPWLNHRFRLLLTSVPLAKNWVPQFAEPITVNVISMGSLEIGLLETRTQWF